MDWVQIFFTAFAAVLSWGYKRLSDKIKTSLKEQKAVENGIQALLRDRIMQLHNHYMEKGYCSVYTLENAVNMFKEYKTLGGNGTVEELIKDLKKLPRSK